MVPPMTAALQNYKSLTVPERIRLVGEIWDSIAEDTADGVSLSKVQESEVERRVADHLADPASGVPWAEVRKKLFAVQA